MTQASPTNDYIQIHIDLLPSPTAHGLAQSSSIHLRSTFMRSTLSTSLNRPLRCCIFKSEVFNSEMCNCYILNYFNLLSHTNKHIIVVTLVQTLPDDNLPVCSSQTVIYTCNTTTGVIRWQEGDRSRTYATDDTLTLNVPERLMQFTVQLISVDASDLSSKAISENTSSSDEGTTIACQDGISSLEESITVAGMFVIVVFM